MKKLSLLFLGFPVVFSSISYADARSNIIIENNYQVPTIFNVDPGNSTGQRIINQSLEPNQYVNIGNYTNDKVIDYNSKININYNSQNLQTEGSIEYFLSNGWTSNTASFKNLVGNIAIEHQNKDFSYSWHSYTTTLKYRIPTFTISACQNYTDIQNSKLANIKRVLIFGDSLSDSGNLYKYTNGIIPRSTPYYSGMFSNGPAWTTLLGGLLKDKIPISNYSVGGATAIFEPEWTDLGLPYTLDTELTAYSIDKGAHDTNKTLAIFFIGANDYLTISPDQDPSSLNNIAQQVTDKIISAVKTINAEKTLIIGLPNLALTPESHRLGNQDLLKQISSTHNKLLEDFALNQTDIDFIPLAPIFDLLVSDTQEFNKQYQTAIDPSLIGQSCWQGSYFTYPTGRSSTDFYKNLLISNPNPNPELLKNSGNANVKLDMSKIPLTPDVTTAILTAETGKLCQTPQKYIFWDEVHPTSQIHEALFNYIAKEYLNLDIQTKL